MARRIPRFTRRRFLGSLGVGFLATGLYTWRVEPHWLEVVKRPLAVRHLPPALNGRTVLQISDIHIGSTVDSQYVIDAFSRLSDLRPDLTVITGDLMSCDGEEQLNEVSRVFASLRHGPLGTFAILGNHDYTYSWGNTHVASSLVARLKDLGIRTLRNQACDVAGLQLVGLDDFWSPRWAPENVLPDVDWGGPTLTLCHNPDAVDLASLEVCRGWILAGHTHGGQCKPPFLPPPLLPVMNKRYTAGEFSLSHDRKLYINRGLGYLHRVRFNVRPEATFFKLTHDA